MMTQNSTNVKSSAYWVLIVTLPMAQCIDGLMAFPVMRALTIGQCDPVWFQLLLGPVAIHTQFISSDLRFRPFGW